MRYRISVIESTKDLSLLDDSQSRTTSHIPQPQHSSSALQRFSLGSSSGSGPNSRASSIEPADAPVASPPPPPSHFDPHRMVALAGAGQLPAPAKCSQQFRKLIHSHSLTQSQQLAAASSSSSTPPSTTAPGSTSLLSAPHSAPISGDQADGASRPILPHLPYSPYGSPSSSPRVRRKPLRETSRVDSITKRDPGPEGEEYVQLNQYKLSGVVGQVRRSLFIEIISLSPCDGD